MTTVHAYTSSQQLVDGPSNDFRRGRAGAVNLLPASTGAALATTKALPELAGRFDGVALRVPIAVGSIADITLVTTRPTSITEVNDVVREEARTARYGRLLSVVEDPIVSTDIIGDPRLGGGHGDDPRRRRLPSQDHELVRQRVGFTHQMGPRVTRHAWRRRRDLKGQMARL
jgi:glyceraldehyde-3-phosphate dehydrogenase type I